jgi:hypothetical protein
MPPSIDEDCRRRFEADRQSRQKPRIEDFLPKAIAARYWPLEMDDLVHLAKDAAGREMTAVEKEEVHVGIGR